MAATLGAWVLIWLGVDSFKLIHSSWHSLVSVRKNTSMWRSDIRRFTNTAMDGSICCSDSTLSLYFCNGVLMFTRFLSITPLFIFELFKLGGRGQTQSFWPELVSINRGEAVRNPPRLVLNHGLWLRATPLITAAHRPPWLPAAPGPLGREEQLG